MSEWTVRTDSHMQHIRLVCGLYTAYMRLKGLTEIRINGLRGPDLRHKRGYAPFVSASDFRVYRLRAFFGFFNPLFALYDNFSEALLQIRVRKEAGGTSFIAKK